MIRSLKTDFGCCVLAALLIACLAACTGDESLSYDPPPEGVPDTPYWYQVGDSVFWFTPADSMAVVQVAKSAPQETTSEMLFALRDLGWRMSVERTRIMQRPGDPQELSQQLFAMEQVDLAVSPVKQHGRFREIFWQGENPVFLGLLPGLKQYDDGAPLYYWPASLVVVWQTGVKAKECEKLLDSLGCEILSSPRMVRNYWIDRSWACTLPVGAELFTWLRLLNDDPRVLLAHPVVTRREPPVPDQRIIRRMAPEVRLELGSEWQKLSDPLKTAYEIAFFSGSTAYIKQAVKMATDRFRFRIAIVVTSDNQESYAGLIDEYDGEIVQAFKFRIDAWLPFVRLPDLAADDRVKSIKEVRSDNLLGN